MLSRLTQCLEPAFLARLCEEDLRWAGPLRIAKRENVNATLLELLAIAEKDPERSPGRKEISKVDAIKPTVFVREIRRRIGSES